MVNNFNAEIETLLSDFEVPVAFLHYRGTEETYIVYTQTDKDGSFAGEDKLQGYIVYYDFDVYSKGNYLSLIQDIRDIFEGAGWTYQPSRDSADQYEVDTGYYHKTICFAKETEGE